MKNEKMQIGTRKFIVSTELKMTLAAVPEDVAANIVNVKIAERRSEKNSEPALPQNRL